ncbi:hypothetical protein ACVS9P_06900 [Caproicibacterium sp. NSD3]
MLLLSLFASLVHNGAVCCNKNRKYKQRLEEARKMGMGMWILDKDGKRKFIPIGK